MNANDFSSLLNLDVFFESFYNWLTNISINSIIIFIMMIFMIVGVVDKIRGNKLGYGEEFDKGFNTIGSLASCIAAIIACSSLLSTVLSPIVTPLFKFIGADPSVFPAILLSADMGGYALSTELALNESIGNFSGIILATIMGPTIVFTIPVAFSMLEKSDHKYICGGVLAGMIAVPFGCLVGGLMMNLTPYKISVGTILINMVPVIFIALLIILGLWFIPDKMIKGFNKFGKIIMAIIAVLTAIAVFQQVTGIMFPVFYTMSTKDAITGLTPLDNGLLTCGQIGIVLIGAFPMMKWITKTFGKALSKLGKLLKINNESCSGLVANMANSTAMFGMVKNMNPKGKLLNLAFAVSASFVFGDLLGFTAGVNPEMVFPMIVGKLTAGIVALIVASYLSNFILNKINAK